MNLLQPFCVDITVSYNPDAIYSLTVPPCDGTTLHPGFDEIFSRSRIFKEKNLGYKSGHQGAINVE